MSKLNVIEQSFELIPPHIGPVDKVARMARICYRSEDNASPESDAKLINACANSGHMSVTEHGFVSVYFSDRKIDPAVFGENKIKNAFSTALLWDQFECEAKRKYLEIYGDDQIYKKVDGPGSDARIYMTNTANFHTWFNIIDDCLAESISQRFVIGVAFFIGLATKLAEEFPVAFNRVIDNLNDAFSKCSEDHFLRKAVFTEEECKDKTKLLTCKCFEKLYKNFDIVVARATPRYDLSVILTTDRATTHQLVRHRREIAYSQESQRYCNYGNRGFNVIRPMIDPMVETTHNLISYAESAEEVKRVNLLPGGYIPDEANFFRAWKDAVQIAIGSYTALQGITLYPKDPKDASVKIKPEVARCVLPNCFATTIGITYTPATFVNVVKWRLEKHAQWPIRSFIGNLILEGLKTEHPFFDNFPPKLILTWLNLIAGQSITTDVGLIDKLTKYQETRQKNLEAKIAAFREAMEAKNKEKEAPAPEKK